MEILRPRFLLLLLTLVVSLHAGSRESAFQGRTMLGENVWSRVLRITNDGAGPGSRYPAEFHGLVVEFEGILWFYTEFDGTQTLSLYAGRLASDRENLGALLGAIEPGLSRYEDVTDQPPSQLAAGAPANACFLGCVARWQELRRDKHPPERARLIAYYVANRPQGHLVLQYWRDGRRVVFDPDRPHLENVLSPRVGEAPMEVARAVFSPPTYLRPVRAQHLDLRPPMPDI